MIGGRWGGEAPSLSERDLVEAPIINHLFPVNALLHSHRHILTWFPLEISHQLQIALSPNVELLFSLLFVRRFRLWPALGRTESVPPRKQSQRLTLSPPYPIPPPLPHLPLLPPQLWTPWRRKPATSRIWKSDLLAHPLPSPWSCLRWALKPAPLPGEAVQPPHQNEQLKVTRLESWAGIPLCILSSHLAWGEPGCHVGTSGLVCPSPASLPFHPARRAAGPLCQLESFRECQVLPSVQVCSWDNRWLMPVSGRAFRVIWFAWYLEWSPLFPVSSLSFPEFVAVFTLVGVLSWWMTLVPGVCFRPSFN